MGLLQHHHGIAAGAITTNPGTRGYYYSIHEDRESEKGWQLACCE